MRTSRIQRSVAGIMAAGLIFAACGSDDATPAALKGDVVVAAGTTLALGDCPDDWSATQGVDGDEIRIGQTLPQSGALFSAMMAGSGTMMELDEDLF